MNKNFFIILLLSLLLSGCATVTGPSPQEISQAEAAHDNEMCQSYGAQPGTSAYIQCREKLAEMRQQRQMQLREEKFQYFMTHRYY